MNKRVQLLGMLLLVFATLGAAAADAPSPSHKAGKLRSIDFHTAVKVGGVLLPAGAYKVQELTGSEDNMLVFESKKHQELVRVHCKRSDLPRKVAQTEQSTMQNDAGEQVLQSVAFAGEKIRHDIQ